MMQRWSRSLVLIVTIQCRILSMHLVNGYSWGAGSCDSGGAVGGYHLESYIGQSDNDTSVPTGGIRCIQSGTLSNAGIDISIGNQIILSESQGIKPLQYNVNYEIQIYRLTSVFRGILIRLSSSNGNKTDLTGKLYTTDPLLQMATIACAKPTIAVGVTHRSSIDKDLVYAYLMFESERNATTMTEFYNLEITLVGMNNEDGSIYAYSSYPIEISGQLPSTNEEIIIKGSNIDDSIVDDNYVPQLDAVTDDEYAGDIESKTVEKDSDRSMDSGQSSSLVIGFTAIGGACLAALFALVLRAKVRRSRVLSIPV